MATSLAGMIGSRSVTRQSPVPSRTVWVAAAAAARQTNGSGERRYCGASARPPERAPLADRDVGVLGEPDRVEPARLGPAPELERRRRLVRGEGGSDEHVVS